jgi:hypothetical protein
MTIVLIITILFLFCRCEILCISAENGRGPSVFQRVLVDCINMMHMRDTIHQIDSYVIISLLKAMLRKFHECVEKPVGLAGAAASKLTCRLRKLIGKEKTASGQLLHGAHACLVPVNYTTSNVCVSATAR